MDAAIIRATFANYRTVSGRKVLQLICEVPIEGQKEVFDALGYPVPDETLWIAIARLNEGAAAQQIEPPADEAKPERPLSQQAAILCGIVTFRRFLSERTGSTVHGDQDAKEFIYDTCGIKSRKELDDNTVAARHFRNLRADYSLWLKGIAA